MNILEELQTIFEGTELDEVIELESIKEMIKEGESDDSISEYLEERISEYELIYYDNAMEYLRINDNSLTESLTLASEMGCELENLNSETLATLLIQESMRQEINGVMDDIRNLIERIEQEESNKES